jgi:methylglutaconyl-CoA hydratase
MSERPSRHAAGQRVRYELGDDGIAEIVLDRPDKRNAIDPEMIDEIERALARAEADEHARVIMLRGEGRDFCAGMDIAHLEATLAYSREELEADALRFGDLFLLMRRTAKPIVAAVHGNALAGGAGLASACDLVLAADDAQFGYPEVHLGFVPAIVMNMLIRNVGEKQAFELTALGDRIDAEEAHRLGLVNRIYSRHTFIDDARAYCVELARRPASSIAFSKALLYEVDELGFAEGVARGAEVNARARETEECRRGIRAFLNRKQER